MLGRQAGAPALGLDSNIVRRGMRTGVRDVAPRAPSPRRSRGGSMSRTTLRPTVAALSLIIAVARSPWCSRQAQPAPRPTATGASTSSAAAPGPSPPRAPTRRHPADGSVEGWRFAVGRGERLAHPRASATFDAALRRHRRRVRQEARRASSSTTAAPPTPRTAPRPRPRPASAPSCAPAATSAEVLAAVAERARPRRASSAPSTATPPPAAAARSRRSAPRPRPPTPRCSWHAATPSAARQRRVGAAPAKDSGSDSNVLTYGGDRRGAGRGDRARPRWSPPPRRPLTRRP